MNSDSRSDDGHPSNHKRVLAMKKPVRDQEEEKKTIQDRSSKRRRIEEEPRTKILG